MTPPRVIGHRGAAGVAPENTLAGFRAAHALGVRWVEFDVQAARDGVPVLLHDLRLDRTTDGHGLATSRTSDELRALDAGAWFGPRFRGERVASFADALTLLDELGMGAMIEVKAAPGDGPRTMRATLEALRPARPSSARILSSFDEAALALAAAGAPEIPRALIVKTIPADWQRRLLRLGASALHVRERGLTPVRAAAVAERTTLRAYTVNTAERARTLFSWGVAAIFTDRPDVINSSLGHGAAGQAASLSRGSVGS